MLLLQNNFEPVKKEFLARASRISLLRHSAIPRRKAPPRAGLPHRLCWCQPRFFNFLNVATHGPESANLGRGWNEAGPITHYRQEFQRSDLLLLWVWTPLGEEK